MKFNELVNESKKVDEAPMGLLKTAGHSMLKKVSPTSAGKLETGTAANQLYIDFKKYLGQTGEKPEADVVLGFLQSRGLPTKGAEAIIQSAGDEKPGALKTAAVAAAGGAIDAATGAVKKIGGAMKSAAGKGIDKLKAAATGQNPQPADRQEPSVDNPTDQSAQEPSQQNKQSTATYSRSTGFDPATMKNTSSPLGPDVVGGIPSTSSPLNALTPKAGSDGQSAAVVGNTKKRSGGKVKGQLSNTPSAVRRRERTAARRGGNTSAAIGQFVNTQTGKNPIKMKTGESIEYHFDKLLESLDQNYILEALSRSTLDKVFLAAVQDAAKSGIPVGGDSGAGGGQQQGGSQSGGQQQGGGQQGGFLSGFKQGFQGGGGGSGGGGDGKLQGQVNVGQLAQLLQMDQRELSAALLKLKQGQGLSRTHVNTLSNAFISMYKADPQTTVRIANMLKRVTVDQE